MDTTYTFTATVSPISATLPFTYSWRASDQTPVTNTGGLSDTATFTWDASGAQTVSLTAGNAEGALTDSHPLTLYVPVRTDFTAWPTSGVEPLEVTFTNTSSGDYTSMLWRFGDGLESAEQNPTHVYRTAGTYTVTLSASGPGGSATETKGEYITVQRGYPIYLPRVSRQNP
jgi:PKD repeat protein